MQIKKLPYSNKHEKPAYRKVKFQKLQNSVNQKNNLENRLLAGQESRKNFSRDIFTPTEFNEIGRVWTF